MVRPKLPGTPLMTAAVPNTGRLEAPPGTHRAVQKAFKHLAGTSAGKKPWKAFWTARWAPGSASSRVVLGTSPSSRECPGWSLPGIKCRADHTISSLASQKMWILAGWLFGKLLKHCWTATFPNNLKGDLPRNCPGDVPELVEQCFPSKYPAKFSILIVEIAPHFA